MEILFMVFMAVVTTMALFAIMVVFRDIVNEVILSRKERENANREILQQAEQIIARAQAQANEITPVVAEPPVEEVVEAPVEEPVVEEAPVEEPVVEAVEEVVEEAPAEEPVAEEIPAEEIAEADEEADDESTISFSTGQRQTLEEKYLALSAEQKSWYDEIVKYAANVEGSKHFKNVRYEEYKVGKNRLVRMLIKRGVIQCEFILHNSDFKNFVNENKISVKQSATTMIVDSDVTVDAAKNSIDIVVAFIAEEKEYKKKLAREKRRAAREAAAAEAAANEQ